MGYDDLWNTFDSKLDNPLIKQTVEFLVTKVQESEDETDAEIAKSALLIYLNSAAPHLLRDDVSVEQALHKSAEDSVEGVESLDAMKELKAMLAEEGILYFGNLGKHLLDDPRGRIDPHATYQKPHGNRPGKREMIGHLADLKQLKPKLDIPRRVDMLEMSYDELKELTDKYIGPMHAGISEPDEDELDVGGRKQGENTTQEERLKNLKEVVEDAGEKATKPTKSLASYAKRLLRARRRTQSATSRLARAKELEQVLDGIAEAYGRMGEAASRAATGAAAGRQGEREEGQDSAREKVDEQREKALERLLERLEEAGYGAFAQAARKAIADDQSFDDVISLATKAQEASVEKSEHIEKFIQRFGS